MVKFRKGGYAENILLTIALCGEFPQKKLEMLGDRTMVLRNLNNLKKEKYVTVLGQGESKTIRLTTKAFPIIEQIDPRYLKYYMSITDNHHFSAGKDGGRQIWRRHRMAEVLCFLRQLEVVLYPWEKPTLSLDGKDKNHKVISPEEKYFYTSRELKNVDENQRYKTEFTRILGTVFSPGGIYNIYNTNKGLMKWNQQGENKAQVLIEDLIRINYDSPDAYDIRANSAIMFGVDFATAIEILESNGGKRDNNNFEMLSFDNTYDNIYYITLDEQGFNQMGIMFSPDWHNHLKELIFEDESQYNFKYSSVDCDAIIGNKYILMMFDGNIGRLKRFRESSFDSESEFEIICFPWQEEGITNYVGDSVSVKCLDLEVVLNAFYD